MSYEKVKSICITEDKVFITSACNNVRPLSYSKEEYPYFTNILKEKGMESVEIALLKSYEEGNLQDGVNKYSKALKVLRYVYGEEYKRFNWRNHGGKWGSEEYKKGIELRESKEFEDLLKKALNYKFSKTRYIIFKDYFGEKVFAKVCLTCVKWTRDKDKATKFYFRDEAKDHIYNAFKDVWGVEEL